MRILLFVCALAALGGCWPEEDIILFDERFEDDLSSRWAVVGQVEAIETVHPGEHGLRFWAPTTMSVAINATVYDQYSDGLWIEYSTSCGGAPLVSLIDESGSYRVWIDLPVTEPLADGGYERIHSNLPPITLPDPWGPYPEVSFTIGALTLATDGEVSASCVIDNLRLVEPAPESGW